MKRMVLCVMLVVIVAVGCVASWKDAQPKMIDTYPLNAQVLEVEHKVVTAIDEYGDEWQFFADGLQVGDEVVLMMNDNGTEDFHDDEVHDVRM